MINRDPSVPEINLKLMQCGRKMNQSLKTVLSIFLKNLDQIFHQFTDHYSKSKGIC